MNQLQVFENELFKVSAKMENGEILFDAEEVALCLGIVQKKNDKCYVRWERVNEYLPKSSPQVGKGDLIPEPLVYKLAFKASNEVAEKFQDWLAIEVIPHIRKTGTYSIDMSQLSPELQMANKILQSLVKQELETKEAKQLAIEAKEETKQLKGEVNNVKNIVALNPKNWRSEVNKLLNKVAIKAGNQFREIRQESYDLLESRAKCNLDIRLQNKRKNMAINGESKSKIDRVNKMDVIASDKRLTEIYLAIVKEMAIKYQIELEGA